MRFGLDAQDDDSDPGPSSSPKATRFAHPLTTSSPPDSAHPRLLRADSERGKPSRGNLRGGSSVRIASSRTSAPPTVAVTKTVVPPWLQGEARKARRGGKLLDESDSDSGSESDEPYSDYSDSSSAASEEGHAGRDETGRPISPAGSYERRQTTRRSIQLSAKEKRRRRDENIVLRIRMATGNDMEAWSGTRTRAFSAVPPSDRSQLRSISVHRDIGSDPAGDDGKAAASWLDKAAESRTDHGNDVAAVLSLLDSMRLRSEEEERRIDAAFAKRNETLWKSIDAAIAKEEAAAAARAAEVERKAAQARAQAAAAEARAKEEEEAAKAREEVERVEAAKRAAEEEEERLRAQRSQTGGGDALRIEAKREWEHWRTVMADIKTKTLPTVAANPILKKQCFTAKRQITPKIGQLTNSRAEIERITAAIAVVLSEAHGASPDLAYPWILNHLSKCLIRQAEQEVAAKQSTAFPLARVAQWLILAGHTRFADVLIARLVKKCCWVLGYCPPRSAASDDEAYRKMVGRGGRDETSLQYTSRLCGISAFFFALLQTLPTPPPASVPSLDRQSGRAQPDVSLIPPTLRPSFLWKWQTRAITPPMTLHAIVPALFATMLEIAGPAVKGMYGKQADKLWKLLLDEGLRNKKAEFARDTENAASTTRLLIVLEGWEKKGRIENPTEGREMDR